MTTTSASEKISQGTLNLTMPGYMVEPLSGQLIGGNGLSAINAQRLNLHGLTKTWQFSVWDLWGMVRTLWDKISVNKWKVVRVELALMIVSLMVETVVCQLTLVSPSLMLTIPQTYTGSLLQWSLHKQLKRTSNLCVSFVTR